MPFLPEKGHPVLVFGADHKSAISILPNLRAITI
jgi:hypothetical protein